MGAETAFGRTPQMTLESDARNVIDARESYDAQLNVLFGARDPETPRVKDLAKRAAAMALAPACFVGYAIDVHQFAKTAESVLGAQREYLAVSHNPAANGGFSAEFGLRLTFADSAQETTPLRLARVIADDSFMQQLGSGDTVLND